MIQAEVFHMSKFTIGLDFGTLSVRALLLNIETGEETAVSVYEYPHGIMENSLPCGKKLPAGWALQDPGDYLEGMVQTVQDVVKQAGCQPQEVVGIGVDVTASTLMPVKADKTPLCMLPEFADEPHAYVKLWKHHGAEKEARQIEQAALERNEAWMPLYGNKVSSEWTFPKLLETYRYAPKVYQEADRFIEALDWIVWILTGQEKNSACCAGYKAFYHHETGYPSRDFFESLEAGFGGVVEEKMKAPVCTVGQTAGTLTAQMAQKLGLLENTPVGIGIIDGHAAVVGSGIADQGTMMVIMGTSSCHMLLADKERGFAGLAGVVKDGMIPGYFGYEAGQSCVGDHFAWVVKNAVPAAYEEEARARGLNLHQLLTEKIKDYKAGQSGLVALDWFNGVRSPLMDFDLNGLLLGMNLSTKPEEIYLALIEATAYGTRMIIDSFEAAGVKVNTLVLGGGIPQKNRKLVQIYADVCQKQIRICGSQNASARGAAILGAAAAPAELTGFADAAQAAAVLGRITEEIYQPDPENAAGYDRLYAEYCLLHDYFGKGANDVMKRLNALRGR